MFKLWSELNPKAKEQLKPDFGFRDWDSLSEDEKYKIWKYLEFYFFDKDLKRDYNHRFANSRGYYYEFFGDEESKRKRIIYSVAALNDKFKVRGYAKNFLEDGSPNSACGDFYEIFIHQDENVVIELLSLYCKFLIFERKEKTIYRIEDETEEEYQHRLEEWRWESFDKFSEKLNEVFIDFGINLYLTRQGFAPRQDQKITKEIYEPVLQFLSNEKWKPVSRDLSDAFRDYQLKTVNGYSSCITHTISAIEAFLQILLYGETGKGTFDSLIVETQKKNLIPKDNFTDQIFKNMKAIFARERKETGDAHPKKEYANERNARTLLNLAMIFLQHCIQK